jgi:TRAP-type C4-dicarboxylate transport system permease small subunit
LKKILTAIDKHVEELLMAISLSGVVIMMAVHVFFRYVVKSPLTWSEEATRYLFIWFVFLGISYGIKNDTHIRVNIIETLYPKVVPIFNKIQFIVTTLFVLYLLPASYKVLQQVNMRHQISAGLHLPMEYVYGSLFLGLCLSVIRIIQKLVLYFTKRKDGRV